MLIVHLVAVGPGIENILGMGVGFSAIDTIRQYCSTHDDCGQEQAAQEFI